MFLLSRPWTSNAFRMGGRPSVNWTSTTAPMTATIWPWFVAAASASLSWVVLVDRDRRLLQQGRGQRLPHHLPETVGKNRLLWAAVCLKTEPLTAYLPTKFASLDHPTILYHSSIWKDGGRVGCAVVVGSSDTGFGLSNAVFENEAWARIPNRNEIGDGGMKIHFEHIKSKCGSNSKRFKGK